MARSSWKGPYVDPHLLEAIETRAKKVRQGDQKAKQEGIRTQSRKSTILPSFVGSVFHVYTGRTFLQVRITEDMVGHTLGEYANTRKPGSHPKRSKKK
uniref:Small ribosomal subunit protein uS19c n=1 Tax=Prasinoderma coloniale TaxID=156133 RepID=V9PAN0_9VIRI|nr:ribosomal protein S19 [Prasinoderma coloniale]AGW52225.1 ribosomal protein S19 [Prasinoderma coloniale]